MASNIQDSTAYKSLESNLSDGDVTAAIDSLTLPASSSWQKGGSESDMEDSLWKIWDAVIAYAIKLPDDQQGDLVKVVQGIQKLGQLSRGRGEACTVWDASVWNEMPVFTAAIREVWIPPRGTR